MTGARGRSHRAATWLLAVLAGIACTKDDPAFPPPTPDDAPDVRKPSLEADLQALGYVDFADEEDLDSVDGLLFHDPERAWPGYTMYVDIPTASAYLVDMEGRERASWVIERAREWTRAEILPGGDILAVGESQGAPRTVEEAEEAEEDDDTPLSAQPFVLRMSWGGEVRWRRDIGAHHDVELTPEGEILVLGESHRPSTERNPECGIVDNSLIRMTLEGEVLDEFSLYEVLKSDPEIHRFKEPHHEEKCSLGVPSDCLHLNSCQWIDRPDLADSHPIFEAGNVLVSSRTQNAIVVVNFARRELIWAWGVGELMSQHEAKVLENGNILLLDNGSRQRSWSRVIELDPVTEQIVWQYRADPPESFYTPGRGTSQALPNGNVLISSSNQGRIFEVTRGGHMVWCYNNPHWTEKRRKKRRGVLRAKRYPEEMIEPLLGD